MKNVKASEQRHFNDSRNLFWLSSLSDDRNAFRKNILKQTLKMWDKDLGFMDCSLFRGKTVLECGCGDMRYGSYIKGIGAKFVAGCDISSEFIRRGLSRNDVYVYDRKFAKYRDAVHGDCEIMPFRKASFDTILIFHSLHHMRDKEAVIRECGRVLKKGGSVIIADLNGKHLLRKAADIVGRRAKIMSEDEEAIDIEEVVRILEKNGFRVRKPAAFNLITENLFHIFNLVSRISETLSVVLKTTFFLTNHIDALLERTVFLRFGNMGWRCLIIAKKAE